MNYLVTGDKHGHFASVYTYLASIEENPEDICVIVLGDAGINYYGWPKDDKLKTSLNKLGCTFFCIHGNHEMRPESILTYEEREWNGGIVYVEPEYPKLLFAKDGEIYDINRKKTLVIGGAYSPDRDYRIQMNPHVPLWWKDEQPSEETKKRVEEKLDSIGWKVDYVLTHTVPLHCIPTEAFLESVDQRKVDRSTEEWLQSLEDRLEYEKWYAGHYHIQKEVRKLEIMYENIHEF